MAKSNATLILGIVFIGVMIIMVIIRLISKKLTSLNAQGKLPISAGVLTYYAPKTLHHTLTTYKTSGFMDLIDDLFVVIQKSDRQLEEQTVCEELGVRYVLMPDNGKMASGFKAIYENAHNDILLFLENDFTVNTSKDDVLEFLLNSLYFLLDRDYDVVRGRSRNHPGEPNYADKWAKESPKTFIDNTHLSESIYWEKHPDKIYPSKISRITPLKGDEAWYTSSSKSCNYTNNPYLCTRQFFSTEIYPYLVFGENIEDKFTSVWSQQDYKCVFGPGLFTHDRSYDGHS
jgi:hypothetical protein